MQRFFLLTLALTLAACNGSSPADAGMDGSTADLSAADLSTDATPTDLSVDAPPRMDAPPCVDMDGDGHGAIGCGGDDCDDLDANRYPGNTEVCDAVGHDEDCNPATLGPDRDGDGFPYWGCCNTQPTGMLRCGTDCDDTRATVNPTAVESCNGVDDNCNGMIDEGVLAHFCTDGDGDGHGDLASAAYGCGMPLGTTTICNDCNDLDVSMYPGATEACDGVDNNCNGAIDEGCACAPDGVTQSCGFTRGACVAGMQTCLATVWEATCAGATLPMTEVCNGVDDDCDGDIDEGLLHTFYPDCDGDGYGETARATMLCGAPTGVPPGCPRGRWATNGGDCDDTDPSRTPLAGCDTPDAGPDSGPPPDGGMGGLPPVVSVAVADEFECGVLMDGEVACQGRGLEGERGNGTAVMTGQVTLVTGISDAVEIVAGGGSFGSGHACARRAGGSVVCWGSSAHGEDGYGGFGTRLTPVAVAGITDATQLAAGYEHTCALRHDGSVACWGAGSSGQLGNGGTADVEVPDVVSGLVDAVEIAAGEYHTCARRMGGAVVCWGNDFRGQLGDGARTNQSAPVPVTGLPGGLSVTQLAGGRYHTCALLSDGSVQCWGANDSGQLGRGTMSVDELVPAPVTGLGGGVLRIALGASHSCAVLAGAGIVDCWGIDDALELGSGGPGPGPTPQLVDIPPDTTTQLGAGDTSSCAAIPSSGFYCWGDNMFGSIGDGATPGDVIPPVSTFVMGPPP